MLYRLVVSAVSLGCVAATLPPNAPTYYKDVAPILQNRCQECHRPGEIAPMALTSYAETRPWAKSIRQAVLTRKMPPWFADSHYGHFSNDRSLSKGEIDTLAAWVDGGSKEGDRRDAPPPRRFTVGWNIATPDLIVEMPQPVAVPAEGELPYQYVVLPLNLTEDRWVQSVEIRPGSRRSVHHVVAYLRDPKSPWLRGEAEPGVPFTPPKDGKRSRADLGGAGNEFLTFYTPGFQPEVWRAGLGKRIKAGSDIVLQLHYTPSGKAESDQTKVGIVFAKEPPAERALGVACVNVLFQIPPGNPAYTVPARLTLPNGGTIRSFMPHLHLRGKAFEYKAVYPSGETETLLKVDNYNFHWQLPYRLEKPLTVPPGTTITCSAVFDNSPNNPGNPDPTASVRWGEQSWEEMVVGFFDLEVPADYTLRDVFRKKTE